MSSVLVLSLSAGLFIGCGPVEPEQDPTPTPATVAVTGVSLNKTALTLEEGSSETLTATVSPDNASNKSVTWKSSATDIATVDDSGKVTAVKIGSATITVTTADGGKTASCSVTVLEKAVIVITGNTAQVPVQGGTAEFNIQYNTSYNVEIEQSANAWLHFVETKAMQSGTLIFKVDANYGDARTGKATVKDTGGRAEPIILSFEQEPFIAVSSVQIIPDTAELEIGETLKLVATVLPEDATDKAVTWKSSNIGIVSVDDEGNITPLGYGETTVTAKAGDKEASCLVRVVSKWEPKVKAILTEFYDALDGPNWKHHENWCSDEWIGNWEGVFVYPDRKIQLAIDGFGLKGEIPECIGDLTELKLLYLRDEPGVTGTLPQSFKKLVNLEALEISRTSMTSLPDVFPVPSKLTWINISFNEIMTGPLPESLGACDGLEVLNVLGNAFTGAPPASWARHYRHLMLSGNYLSGPIPDTFLTGEDVPYKLLTILNQNPPGLDISGIDIKGCWSEEPVEDIITGETFKFADVVKKNKYTVYLEWAPWCPFSKALMPQLLDYYKQYHKDGLEIIATVMNSEEQLKVWDDRPGQIREINEKGYGIWYNCYSKDFMESGAPIYPSSTPQAEVYDSEGNVLFSGFFNFSDPVRNRYGHPASTDLIPFLETLLGPAYEIEEYTSTDYSKDGEVMTLQTATVGKGIDLVLMGDGYTDKDMGTGGLYETLMKQCMEEFFAIEPYKTFRDRFNVYAVKVVSKNGWTGPGYETALGAVFTHGSSSNGVIDKCLEYALKVPSIKDTRNLMVSVLVNSSNSGGITVMLETEQSGVAFSSSERNNPESFGMILRHEAGGHAFAFLDDEYYNKLAVPQEHIDRRNYMYQKYGWYANVDFTPDPAKVKWSAFLSDERYSDEVGIFEGGSLYGKGAYRPTNHSMMNDHYEYFNAPSRWAIYKRIMELSGETASFDDFLEYDAVNRGQKQKDSAPRSRSKVKIKHTPPAVGR